jgi:hypothetical protein
MTITKIFHFTLLLVCFSAFTAGQFALASEEGLFTRIHHQYQSNRAMGMGDAFIAVTNDYSAIFYNPAALARRETGQFNGSIEVGVSNSFNDFYKDFKDPQFTGTESQKFDQATDLLKKHFGKTFSARIGLMHGILARPYWGLAILPLDLTTEFKIHGPELSPSIHLRTIADTTIAYAYANEWQGLLPGRLSWGTTAKFVNRAYANGAINALDLTEAGNTVGDTFSKERVSDGFTIDFDLGALYTPELPGDGIWYAFKLAKPTFGAVLRNVLDYGFESSLKLTNKNRISKPEKLHRVLDLGAKFEYPELWIFGGRGAIDFRDIMHPNVNFRKSLHIGFEFDWSVFSWWKGAYRVGLNQGYMTAGISALLFTFNLDLVTYGEDVGSFGTTRENRVYMAKFNLDF